MFLTHLGRDNTASRECAAVQSREGPARRSLTVMRNRGFSGLRVGARALGPAVRNIGGAVSLEDPSSVAYRAARSISALRGHAASGCWRAAGDHRLDHRPPQRGSKVLESPRATVQA